MAIERSGVKGQQIEFYARFQDQAGNPVQTDTTPQVEITDSNGAIALTLTNTGTGAVLDDPGLYRFTWSIPLTATDGYHMDRWVAAIGGETVTATFMFLVKEGGSVEVDIAPTFHPDSSGPAAEFNFTKCEADGISCLMRLLKARVKNDGTSKVETPLGSGVFIDVPCPVFSDSELICFLVNGLSEFNQQPHFSNFSFCDADIIGIYADVVVQGAQLVAMSAQALIEKGREFVITDNGVTYQPPAISEILSTMYTTQLAAYRTKLKEIKMSLKPSPKGLGTFRVTAVNPNFLRLRHLRARQIL